MKKTALFLAALLITLLSSRAAENVICHCPPGNLDNCSSITVGGNAAAAHLSEHPDDFEGPCEAELPPPADGPDPPCDIFAQDCPNPHPDPEIDPNESCYILFTRPEAPTVCFPAFPEDGQANPGGQDQLCNFINTCQQGYGCILPDDPEDFQNLVCAAYCDPTNSGGPSCSDTANGGPGPAYSCHQLNPLVYGDLPDVPENVGACALTELWGKPRQEAPPRRKRLLGPPDLSPRGNRR